MANDSKSNSSAGISAVGVLQLIFICMKVWGTKTAIYGWPWWKVMLPLICSVSLSCCLGCTACWTMICCANKDTETVIAVPGQELTADQLKSAIETLDKINETDTDNNV